MRGVKEKVKFPLWIRPDIMEQVRAVYAEDDCRSQSEYIEKAIKFYLAYKTTEQKDSFLPSVFLSEIRGILSESDHRHVHAVQAVGGNGDADEHRCGNAGD